MMDLHNHDCKMSLCLCKCGCGRGPVCTVYFEPLCSSCTLAAGRGDDRHGFKPSTLEALEPGLKVGD